MNHVKYLWGFVLSLALTISAYWLATQHLTTNHSWPPDGLLLGALIGIALAQLLAQLALFLHVGEEAKPRWRLMVGLFAAMVVVVLVIGSLWIMSNLDYHMSDPGQTDTAIMQDEGIDHHARDH